jgi:TRAP-type C4-dicarboxylate transport system permease small subunit
MVKKGVANKMTDLENQDVAQITEWNAAPSYIKGLSFIVAILMFAMIALIFIDVIGRYGFGLPIPAGFEITEFVMATMIFSAIPLVSYYNSHITVNLFDAAFRGTVRKVQQSFVLLFSMVMLGFMGNRLFDQAEYLRRTEQLGQQLDIQVAPVVYGTSLMSFVACIFMAILLINYWRTGIEPTTSGSLD